jgi:transcriptional regulator with XRE-family HTH domain
MAHIGNNIAKLRGFRRIPQKDIAAKLSLSQQEYSKIESTSEIDENMLNLIAKALDFPVELIRSMDSNGHVENLYQQDGNKGHVFNYDFNSTEKIVELYERLLKEKDAVIEMYKKQQKAS